MSENSENSLLLSPGQYDIWLEQQLYPNDCSNHFHFIAKIREELNIDALQSAICRLAERHEVIRTIFPLVIGTPVRQLVPITDVNLQIEECSHLSEEDFKLLIRKNFETPFDLSKIPPCRFLLYKRSALEYFFQIIEHHIAATLKDYAHLPLELAKLYISGRNGQTCSLPKKSVTYSDFVQKYHEYLQSDRKETDKDYWMQYLSGILPTSLLPLEQTSDFSNFSSGVYHLELDNTLVANLKKIARSHNLTIFSLMTAAFQLLISRYTKQDEIITGIPTDVSKEIEDGKVFGEFFGYTTNTLPLRSKILPEQEFSQFAIEVSRDIRSMSRHRLYPMTNILDDLRAKNGNKYDKLFKVLVVSQKIKEYQELALFGIGKQGVVADIEGLKYESVGIGHLPTGRFDLTLAIVEATNEFVLSFHYNTFVFKEIEITGLSQNYLQLLHNIVCNPQSKIDELAVVSDEEQDLQLNVWNCTATTIEEQKSFLVLFEERVAANPKAVAIVFEEIEITYDALNRLANQLGRYLQTLNVTKDTLVAVGVERSPELIIALIGVIKAGGAYLPLDPEHPSERIQFMLEDSQAQILITQKSLQKTFQSYKGETVFIDSDWDKISKEKARNLATRMDPDQLAYVIYTSGSTGKPKGVEIFQQSVTNLLESIQTHIHLSKSDRWLASTTISFDISNLEIFLPLRQGATVVLVNQETIKDPSLLSQAIEKNNISHAQATPSMWQMLVDFGWKGSKKLAILCGGEALSQALAEKLVKISRVLWNMYGPTETTIWSSMKKIENPREKITIGRPLANTTFYILDENGRLQPLGVPGELYIGGIGLAKGYKNKPELSKERFIPSFFTNSLSKKLYKTGDLACYMPNGEIECMGRIDRQVKIRGYRIELEEIEEILKKCEGVQQTAVVVLENKLRDKRIIAYCTGTYNEQQIKQTLGSQLPNYMMPSAYVHLPHLPLTPNGKIDRKALPIPQYGLDDLDYDPPRNPVEMEVVKIFESFLDLERVSINANFFSLGGHSLLAARIITQINREFHINLPLKTLFEKPTVSLIAKEIEIALRGYKAPSISKAPEANTFELSYSQQRFWFLEQQTKNTAAYSIPLLIEFIGEVDFAILQRSVKTIIDRHEILRTVFKEGAEGPEQFFLSDIKPLIRYEELSNEKDVKNLITEESKKSFELSSGPLFRFLLIRTQKNRHLFFLNFHHIIFDGYSINIFIEELKALYIAYKQKQPTTLQDLNIQYVDYVRWQNNSLEKVTEENQAAWWVEKLYDAPSILNLSTDKQRPPIQTYNGALHEFPLLNHADLATLKKLSQKHELTLFMILLAAFHVFLYRYTGQNDIIIGIPVSGRNHADLNSLIGCFINTIAFRTTSSSKDAFLDFLTWIRDEAFEAFKHQDVPFEKVVEKLKMERLLSHSLLFQVMFNMLPKLEDNYIQDIQMNLRSIDRGMAHFDLSLSVQETPEGLLGIFEYNTDLFFNETIKCMAKHFKRLLQEIIKNPEQSIGKLPLLAEDEVQKQVVKWNKQDILYPKDESIIQLIEKWAKCSPDSIAIICKEKSYSYYEINAQANKIANALLSFGIQSEDRVVVCLERSAEFISTILGILKAGGVYVPIDPLAPKERVESILQDLQPFRILTHSTFQNRFSGFSTLCIDELTTSMSHNPLVQIAAKQLAYIIYTSGSTGNPKGVEIEHRSINDRVLWKNAAYPLSPSDVMLHTYSFIFDGAIINYFWPLCVGASLVIASEEEQLDPAALVQLIRKYKVTTMDLLPSLLQGLLDEQEITHCHSIKNVFSGGEALPGELLQLFYKKCAAKLHNTYGPTEATVEASVWECEPDYQGPIAPIGKPIAGAKLYILDRDQNIVPIGVPGELHIGGVGLARGYFNASSLTAEKFIQSPFSKSSKDRLYRTGDLVKYRSDGIIEFLGRIDNQVKIRGFRIDLREIESSLLQIDSVDKAIVVIKGQGLHKHLVGYAVLNLSMGEREFYELMKTSLGRRLPTYMIPQRIVILDKFPTLLNGKINYKALPEPTHQKNILPSSRKECRCDLEYQLLSVWREILECEDLAVTDNFFEVGGNSLLAMRLVAKIKRKLGISVPLIHLFQNPTIEEFVKSLSILNAKKSFSPIVLMRDGGDKTPFFCVHPVGGNVLCYRSLAKHWANDRPFYAIQAPGLEEGEVPHDSIEKMAKEYIKSIQEIQSRGPYILGGWSFGGLIAAEMTNQLRKQGEEISLLVLIDTTANIEKFRKINVEDDSLLLSELTHHFIAKPNAKKTRLSFKEQFVRFIENGGKSASKKKQGSAADRLIALAKTNYRALQRFSIPTIDVDVALIRTEANPERSKALGWNKYATKLNVFHAPGDHWAITEDEQAQNYAQILQNCFATLETEKVLSRTRL